MAAAKGNKYAEKWTNKKALELAEQSLAAVDDDTYFISSIAEKVGQYRDLYTYLMEKFADEDEQVFRTLKRMYNKCEAIIFQKSAKGEIDKTIAIFALKTLHGLFEKSQFDHTTKGDKIESGIGIDQWLEARLNARAAE